jgi:hypothetical protein
MNVWRLRITSAMLILSEKNSHGHRGVEERFRLSFLPSTGSGSSLELEWHARRQNLRRKDAFELQIKRECEKLRETSSLDWKTRLGSNVFGMANYALVVFSLVC